MKISILFSLLIILAVACQSPSIPQPQTQLDCVSTPIQHPKASELEALIEQYTSEQFVGLTLLVDQNSDGYWLGSAGYAEVESQTPMTPCHLGYTASIIKTFIGLLVLQLEEEGKLSLTDKVSEHLAPSILQKLPNGNDFSIAELLQNRSGMPDVFEIDFILDLLNQPHRSYEMEELLSYLEGVAAVSPSGERFYYGDGNFILLSLLIQQLEGDLRQVYQKRIFDPLQLNNSYLIDDVSQLPSGIAASYWDRYGSGKIENISDYQIALAAGLRGTDGLIMSATDLNTFLKALTTGQLITDSSYQKMLELIHIPEIDRIGPNYDAYGLGIGRTQVFEKAWIGSFGNHIGSSAMMLTNLEDDTRIILMQNTGTFFNDASKQQFFYHLLRDLEGIIY
ncbi:MAG: serine hydrolase domain-containing protein [Bacteroidota bacterium]